MEQALQDLRITSSILQRKYNDLESEKKQLEKDMEEKMYFNDPILFLFNYNGLKRNVNIPLH